MGLDTVEFIIDLENAFQINIPDETCQRMVTPRQVVAYILSRVGVERSDVGCLSQRAFYRLRRAAVQVLVARRGAVRPDTRWVDLVPGRFRPRHWRLLRQAAGFGAWPAYFGGRPCNESATLGGTALFLAERHPGTLLRVGEGWTCSQIEEIVGRFLKRQLGVADFGWDQELVKDLGMN